MLKVASGTLTAVLCLVGFLAGGLRFSIGSLDGNDSVEVDSVTTIALGSALALGPLAALPAAMTALGQLLIRKERSVTLKLTVDRLVRSAVLAGLAGLAFESLRGHCSTPASLSSLPAVLATAALFRLGARWISREKLSTYSYAVSLGASYGLAGAVTAMQPFAVLSVSLPFAVALLGLLRQSQQIEVVEVVEAEESVEQELEDAEPNDKPSLLDTLTGLANQRYLEMFLQQEISRSERSGQPITVMLVDIDNFSQLNGKYGDEAADGCLAAIGSELRRMLREYDVVGRYKDDEFLIVLPETTASAGHETAARLHAKISGQILPHQATFSIGVATYPTYGTTVDDLLSSAHHALNRAKFSGKNSIRSCHELAKAS